MIAGIFLAFTGFLGIWLGALVDHHGQIAVMADSSSASLVFFAVSLGLMQVVPEGAFANPYSLWLWALVFLVMGGVIAGDIRSIALPTLVTLLIAEDERDKANGLVGMVSGPGFLVTSAVSGLLVAWGGMQLTLIICVVATLVVLIDIRMVPVLALPQPPQVRPPRAPRPPKVLLSARSTCAEPSMWSRASQGFLR